MEQPADNGIYIRDQHDGEEIRRAIQISTLGACFDAPVTFCPESAAVFPAAWGDWLDGRWDPYLAKHLVDVYVKGRGQEVNEILKLDAALTTFLDSDEAARSFEAGASLLDGAKEARHHRVVAKMLAKGESGESAAHGATVFAAHAAAYHVPLFSVLVSYLYLEWRCGAAAARQRQGRGAFDVSEKRFAADAMGVLGNIRALLKKHLGDFAPAACA